MLHAMRALALALIFSTSPALAEPSLLAPGAALEKVHEDVAFGEGPAWNAKGGFLLFEDSNRNRILKLGAEGKVDVFRGPSGRSNGLAWDAQGRLVVCEGHGEDGGRRVSRTEKDGKIVTLADRYQGKRLNSPNDLAIDAKGRIYFTDPRYSKPETKELDREAVYRIDPDGKLTRVVDSLTRPNGLVISRDGKTLYVADNASPGGVVTLVAFDLDGKGDARNGRVLYDFVSGRGIDGMTQDSEGRIWATAGTGDKAGVYVFQPDAKRTKATVLTVVKTPEDPTNVTFGGKDRKTLYITTAKSLFRIQTAVTGVSSPPGK